jgi:hypothetical protein
LRRSARSCPETRSILPGRNFEPSALVGGTLTHVGVAVRTQHVDMCPTLSHHRGVGRGHGRHRVAPRRSRGERGQFFPRSLKS